MAQSKIVPALLHELKALPPEAELGTIVLYRRSAFSPRALVPGARPLRVFQLIPAMALSARAKAIHLLEEDPRVVKIWPDLPVKACLDVAVQRIGAPRLWAQGLTGRGVGIAILDTGIDSGHPDFAGRIRARESFVGPSADDEHGHGTHVAGAAAGSGAASGGRYRGVAPQADLYVARVLARDGSGRMSEVMAGIDWAVRQPVQVINLSLGGAAQPSDGADALSTMCDAAVEAGYVLCCAAGNGGPQSSTIGSPAAARLVLTVGAVDDDDRVAAFSSRGPTSDGRPKPDLVLPGVGIISTRARGTRVGDILNERYVASSGTSMASPQLAGAVALLLQASPGLTPAEIRSLLVHSAVPLGEPESAQGAGRVDLARAYLGQPQPGPTSPPGEPSGCASLLPRALAATLFGRRGAL